jgi:transcriptional regulator with XRE-family HTH domain
MIKNQRQYAVTLKQLPDFENEIAALENGACPSDVDPIIFQAQLEGMKSQLLTLKRELAEYLALKEGRIDTINLKALDELPKGLIKARIARAMTQKDLAEKMGLTAQQIQRWEYEDYENVSFSNLVDVAEALGIDISECIRIPSKPRPAIIGLTEIGLDKNFIRARLVPSQAKHHTHDFKSMSDGELLAVTSARLKRIFGCSIEQDGTFSANDDQFRQVSSTGRFKLPVNADPTRVRAYAVYANYLANIVAKASVNLPKREIPRTWGELRKALCGDDRPTFSRLVEGAWSLGIAVLPLMDPIRFHGFCCRIEGRNVLVIKQSHRQEARWAFDLIHEIYHAGEMPESLSLDANDCDATDSQRRESEDEAAANELAGAVLLNGRANELYEQVRTAAARAGGDAHLKRFTKQVAQVSGVDQGHLANYIAFRLRSDHFMEWWGVATTLQTEGEDPAVIAREALLRNVDLQCIDADDRDLLQQSIRELGLT